MKIIFGAIKVFVMIIVVGIFMGAVALTVIGLFHLVESFACLMHLKGEAALPPMQAGVGIVRGMDVLLLAIVMFVFSLGLLVLLEPSEEVIASLRIPGWLRVRTFMDLKVVLWEAILTTLLIGFLTHLVDMNQNNMPITVDVLVLPLSILLLALALFFLKKGEH